MGWRIFETWLGSANLFLVAAGLFAALCGAAALGAFLHRQPTPGQSDADSGQEGYIVSAILGLLALLLGFTFSMAVDRFDARRVLVLQEANAISTAYLRAQLLDEPHRSRMSSLLVRYTDNRIGLARATPGGSAQQAALRTNDALVTDIWAAASAAFDSIKTLDFSSSFIESVNAVTELDASRKIARMARVPPVILGALVVYMITAAGFLGYVLSARHGRHEAALLMALLTLSLILIIDIDRPVLGGVSESQRPMEELRASLVARPSAVFDKWRKPAPR